MENSLIQKAQPFMAVFDEYNKAVSAGIFESALDFRTSALKSEIIASTGQPEDKMGFMMMAKAGVPQSYNVEHIDAEDGKQVVYMTGQFQSLNPEEAGKIFHQEFKADFVQESGVWKMGTVIFIADVDSIKKSQDQTFEPKDHYDLEKHTNLGGRVVSVQFENDYTLVTLRIVDEEDLVFLPNKAGLDKSGLQTDMLVPWTLLEVDGCPHKTNRLKIWGITAKIISFLR